MTTGDAIVSPAVGSVRTYRTSVLAAGLRTFFEIGEKCEKKKLQTPHHDHTVTNRGDDNDLLRLDVVDSVPSKPSEQAKSTSLSKCPVFPTYVLYFNFFMWSKVMIPVGETKMSISDMTVSTWTFKTRLQGAEGVTFGKQNTTTGITESVSSIFAVSAQKGSLSANDTRAP